MQYFRIKPQYIYEAGKKVMLLVQYYKIIELFFERSERAIWEPDSKYGKACFKFLYNSLNDRQDAEECVNDSYLGAWDAIPPARPDRCCLLF